jgi:hypothetical protein
VCTQTAAIKPSDISLKILSVAILVYFFFKSFHLFDKSVDAGFLFYFTLGIEACFFLSALAMWVQKKWSVYLFTAATLALLPAYIYIGSWDYKSILMLGVVLVVSIINWKNLK